MIGILDVAVETSRSARIVVVEQNEMYIFSHQIKKSIHILPIDQSFLFFLSSQETRFFGDLLSWEGRIECVSIKLFSVLEETLSICICDAMQ